MYHVPTATPQSVAVAVALVVVGMLSFALGTKAASDASSRSVVDGPLDSCRNQVDSRENSRTHSAATKSARVSGSTGHHHDGGRARPTAIATWRFGEIAVAAAKISLENGGTALDALEAGDKCYISIRELQDALRAYAY